jgi:hypothetical protein
VAQLARNNTLLPAWKITTTRLQTDDERNLHTREAAASSILDKATTTASTSTPTAEADPITAQVYELITQLARLTRDLLPDVHEAKDVVRYVPRLFSGNPLMGGKKGNANRSSARYCIE